MAGSSSVMTPEQQARAKIDVLLRDAGWAVQNVSELDLTAGRGIAVREFSLKTGHGSADYLLYVDRKVVGVVEAKKAGDTLTGVEVQTEKYGAGLPDNLPAPRKPLPFLYQSTGIETKFTDAREPDAASRDVFSFHRPETFAGMLLEGTAASSSGLAERIRGYDNATLLARLKNLPPLDKTGMRDCQVEAITHLEASLAQNRRRALVQMQTGSGKTYTAVAQAYRLIKFGRAKRILFLVDRGNLAEQTLKEFGDYVTPDDGRKFTELYNVQRLTSNAIADSSKVVITTIQRLYSILRGEEEFDEANEMEGVGGLAALRKTPLPVEYNPQIPIETFDFVFTDECHRSIYNLWRQVLEYFDAYLVGLTATPSKQTLGFFHQNLVMEYGHRRAVADRVNVDFDVYRIETKITAQGATLERKTYVDKRDRKTRKVRWQELDDDLTYRPNDLDKAVVAEDQIRTVVKTFRDKLFEEIFPGRTEVPKTLIFAKNDSHADDIVRIVREEFGKGNEFCEKITYRTSTARIVDEATGDVSYKSSGIKPEDLLSSFRNGYHPRVVVTVDMIATGTDVKPLEIVLFMRDVQSRNYFDQMRGRGCRVIDDADFQGVTPDAKAKTRYVLVDAVGVTDHCMSDTVPLEQKPFVPLKSILGAVGAGSTDEDVVSTLAGRLNRLDKVIGPGQRQELERLAGKSLPALVRDLVQSLDPDLVQQTAVAQASVPANVDLDDAAYADVLAQVGEAMRQAAVEPFLKASLRQHILSAQQDTEQTVDKVTADEVLFAGASPEATDRARGTVASFRQYLDENREEIEAIGVLYSRRRGVAPTLRQLKELAQTLERPPRAWTTAALWRAYETLEASKVKGRGGEAVTDLVSLVRFALEQETILAPFAESVDDRFAAWLATQEASGRVFTPDERRWLETIRDHVKTSMTIDRNDLDLGKLGQMGGLGAAYGVFGERLDSILRELNEVLVA